MFNKQSVYLTTKTNTFWCMPFVWRIPCVHVNVLLVHGSFHAVSAEMSSSMCRFDALFTVFYSTSSWHLVPKYSLQRLFCCKAYVGIRIKREWRTAQLHNHCLRSWIVKYREAFTVFFFVVEVRSTTASKIDLHLHSQSGLLLRLLRHAHPANPIIISYVTLWNVSL